MTALASVRDLVHRYPNGRLALDHIAFELGDAESVALVGPNGAGKSTLFFRLAGILPGGPGMIRIGDLDPSTRPVNLPEAVGILFQNPDDQLFCPTVADDVAFGPTNLGWDAQRIDESVRESLEHFKLAELADRPPFQLSGGEKRRAALASILIMRPKLLLLDEPTAHLDPRGRRDFVNTIRALPGTKLIATHDLDFALDVCPRTILLDGGRLYADGPTETVLQNTDLMTEHGLEVPWRLRPQ